MAALPPPSSPTIEAIYAAYEAAQDSGFRSHLGASIIGTECERALFYSFRWATRARHAGRLLRLFDTGNLAEARFCADLRRIGVTVLEVDPSSGRQWSCRDDTGHFGGSADAALLGLPEGAKTWTLGEFKTHGNKSFTALKKDGVAKAKPLHAAQVQVYMHLLGLTRAFYLAVNKDTEELYGERINYDKDFAVRLLAKAARIINATSPPPRISEDPSWYQCRFCDHNAVCHGDAKPERHCRSCAHSTPVADGAWHCALHDCLLTRKEQEAGCPSHRYIPSFVRGQQTDVDGDAIIYLLTNGETWRDEG